MGLIARKPVFGGGGVGLRSLISAIVIRFLESFICKLAIGELSVF